MLLMTRKFTVAQYEKMRDVGIIGDREKIELIEGEIIEMSPIGLKHMAMVMRLTNILPNLIGNNTLISIQNPITLNDYSQPEPDLVLLKYRQDYYETKQPTPADILLLIEVSDSTIKYDREIKLPIYATNDVQEVWLINLNNETIEVYRYPQGTTYQHNQIMRQNEVISSLKLPELFLKISEIFNH
jgi:Uma2 family endonuclease